MQKNLSTNHKLIKTITKWPLSKVALIKIDSEKYIKKTVHKDFKQEYDLQKFLYHNLVGVKVPKVYGLELSGNLASFLMENIDSDSKVTDKEALELLFEFQNQPKKIADKSFTVYDFTAFERDVATAAIYGVDLKAEDYKEIFDEENIIVHGDFGRDQIIKDKNGEFYLIDFAKSFTGPSILDTAYFCRKDLALENMSLELYKYDSKHLLRAKIVVGVMQISWYHLCQTKYIKDHDYVGKEIKDEKSTWVWIFGRYKTRKGCDSYFQGDCDGRRTCGT